MRLIASLFVGVSLVCGLAFWWHHDWWGYWEPKLEMPWYFQLAVSSVVGMAAGLPAAGVVWVVRRDLRRRPVD